MKLATRLALLFTFAFCLVPFALGQSKPYEIRRPCPNNTTFATVTISASGAITGTPCTGKTTTITGLTTPNLIESFATQATAAGTTTLLSTSPYQQYFTGTTTQTVLLPTTGVVQGQQFQVTNLSTDIVTVQSSGGNTIATLGANTSAVFTALVATPTTAANWNTSTLAQGTLPSSQPFINQSATYNAGGVTFHGLVSNVTNTASAAASMLAEFQLAGVTQFGVRVDGSPQLARTITAIGTTGNQTINKPAGTINVAAAAGAVTLTDSLIDVNTIPVLTVRTADATCTNIKSAVPAAGSLVITMNANCTAATSIGFLVTN